jgi:UDP-N-acetylmuramoyl-L-alanyl-D-glutamate--2,6-diaminopimelate ligase
LKAMADIEVTTVSSQGADADWRARDITSDLTGSRFVVDGPGAEHVLHVQLPGAFNVANALLAFVTLVTAGVDPDAAAAGIGNLAAVPGRLEAVSVGQPFLAVVDYAHTPAAVVTLLTMLRATATGRLIVVLGCGGDRDRAKRRLMGAAAARLADVAVLTSDNPRSEDPAQIVAAMVEGANGVASAQRASLLVELDRRTAIAMAVELARPGDIVVVAGKGHEQGQEIAGVVQPFDDRLVLRAQLSKLAAAGGVT